MAEEDVAWNFLQRLGNFLLPWDRWGGIIEHLEAGEDHRVPLRRPGAFLLSATWLCLVVPANPNNGNGHGQQKCIQGRSEQHKVLGKLERLGSAPRNIIQSKIQGWKSRKGNSLLPSTFSAPGSLADI